MAKKPNHKKPYNPAPPKISGVDYGTRQRGAGVGKHTHVTSPVSRALDGIFRPKPAKTGLQKRSK